MHKGKHWETAGRLRIFAGQAPWPFWPAKTYLMDCALTQIGTGAPAFATGEALLVDDSNPLRLVYATPAQTVYGVPMVVKGYFSVETNLMDSTSHWQWYFSGAPQIDGPGFDGAWLFCRSQHNWVGESFSGGALPSLPGATVLISPPTGIRPKPY